LNVDRMARSLARESVVGRVPETRAHKRSPPNRTKVVGATDRDNASRLAAAHSADPGTRRRESALLPESAAARTDCANAPRCADLAETGERSRSVRSTGAFSLQTTRMRMTSAHSPVNEMASCAAPRLVFRVLAFRSHARRRSVRVRSSFTSRVAETANGDRPPLGVPRGAKSSDVDAEDAGSVPAHHGVGLVLGDVGELLVYPLLRERERPFTVGIVVAAHRMRAIDRLSSSWAPRSATSVGACCVAWGVATRTASRTAARSRRRFAVGDRWLE